ncbi:MAG: lysostaphin resistance A-like protein, partial [Anaerostipes hadrus]
ATLIYLKVCGDDMKTTLRIRPIHIGSFFLVILLAFTIRPVAGFITLIANLFFKDVTTTTMTEKVMQNLSLSIFTTAFLPGLVEETIFRGVVYSRVRKANPIKGILLSALFFGIAHMNFQQFCYAFFLGIVFGFLIEATDSIVSSMTAHMVFNASSLLLTYLLSKADIFKTAANNASSTSIATIIASVPMALIGLLLSILLILAIAYLNGRLGYMKTWFHKECRALWPKEKAAGFSFLPQLVFVFCFLS